MLAALSVICLSHLPLAFESHWSLAFGKSLSDVSQIEIAPKSLEINVAACAQFAWVELKLFTGEWCMICVFVCVLALKGVTTPPKVLSGSQEGVASSISSKSPGAQSYSAFQIHDRFVSHNV